MSQPVDIPSSDQAIQEMHVVDDSDYIDCYNHFGIHQEMLQVSPFEKRAFLVDGLVK